MKKRAFLSPLVVSVAALLSANPVEAKTDVTLPTVQEEHPDQAGTGLISAEDPFVIERNNATGPELAGHYSHRSHVSHQSHVSHYSSSW